VIAVGAIETGELWAARLRSRNRKRLREHVGKVAGAMFDGRDAHSMSSFYGGLVRAGVED
jgi:hypothetical protein